MADPLNQIKYDYAGPTIERFHKSDKFARCIVGPFGSGKTVANCVETIWRAAEQEPGRDGKRRTRAAIIRNTYPALKTTSIKTFKEWTGGAGTFNLQPPVTYTLKSGAVDLEVLFLALDSDTDVAKLLSLELSFAFVNELREIPLSIFQALTGRVGRYPPMFQGVGPSYSGIIADSNPWDDSHWAHKLFVTDPPSEYELFHQPSGLGPDAENLANLPGGQNYYTRLAQGKDEDFIAIYCHGKFGTITEGRAVYSNYREAVHVAPEPLQAVPGLPLLIGCDFGLQPSAVIGQVLPDGRRAVLSEAVSENMGIVRFANILTEHLREHYPRHEVDTLFGDPAGNQRVQTDERTVLEVLREATGFRCRPAPTNDFAMRREAVLNGFGKLVDGKPALIISPTCTTLRQACAGKYCFRELSSAASGATHADRPDKGPWSHVAEALQYFMLGSGGAGEVLNRVRRDGRRGRGARPVDGLNYDVLDPTGQGQGGGHRRDPGFHPCLVPHGSHG
ncbi:MAG: hypothetical protein Q8P46_16350 [Hyphomicrobiales bacterium]|nr:hypothetical protein [Hyphomicrobiales bacterium]